MARDSSGMPKRGQSITSKGQKSTGTSPSRKTSSGAAGSPRGKDPVSSAATAHSGSPTRGRKVPSTAPSTPVTRSRVLKPQATRSQQNLATGSVPTTSSDTEGYRTGPTAVMLPEPEVVKQPAPEPVPEPPAPSSRSGSRDSSPHDACVHACRTTPNVPAANGITPTSKKINESTIPVVQDVDTSRPERTPESNDKGDADLADERSGRSWEMDNSNSCAWPEALGGKLDDLCERTLALEQELRAQCWQAPMERTHTDSEVQERPSNMLFCRAGTIDVMADLQRRMETMDVLNSQRRMTYESIVDPEPADNAVERELYALRNRVAGMEANFGELKALVQQLGGELRSFHKSMLGETSPRAQPNSVVGQYSFQPGTTREVVRGLQTNMDLMHMSPTNNSNVHDSSNYSTEPTVFAAAETSSVSCKPCSVRVSPQLVPSSPCAPPATAATSMSVAAMGTAPVINAKNLGAAGPSTAAVGTSPQQQSVITTSSLSHAQTASARGFNSLTPISPRSLHPRGASPVRRYVSMPSTSCAFRSAPTVAKVNLAMPSTPVRRPREIRSPR